MGTDKGFKTMIGGQAIIEGVMMRGPDKSVAVVRGPEGLQVRQKQLVPIKSKYPLLGWPFIRGVVNFVDSMAEGMRALTWSAELFPEGEEETPSENPSRFSLWLDKKLSGEKAQKAVMTAAIVLGVALSVGIFMLLPAFLTGLIGADSLSGVVSNLIEGAVRLVILVGYLALISRMKDIRRVFGYHGAEHKTIACYEAGAGLTVENVRGYTRFHPRCGTSFLFMVVIISILVFSLALPFEKTGSPVLDMLIRLGARLVLLPVVVALTYELNRQIGRRDNLLARFLRAPGLWLQRLTTNEPDDAMLEVGIEALKQALPEQRGADEWGKDN
jgi:uncharacterized protein YqhQ